MKMVEKTDSGSSVAPNKPDVCCIACRKRKILSEGEEHSNTASSPNTPDPRRTKLQRSEYGSVTKEIEALRARKAKLLGSLSADVKARPARTWQLSNPHVAMSSKNLVILDSDEEDHCNRMHGYSATVDKPVVIIDSDDEEFEDQMHSNPCEEVVVMEPADNFPMKDLSVKWNNNPVQANDYEDKKDGNEAIGSPINYNAQLDRSLPLNTEENTEDGKRDEVKALRDEVEFLPDKCNIQIGNSSYDGTGYHTPSRKDKKEVGYLLPKCNTSMEQRLCVGTDKSVEAREHKDIKSPSSIDKNADVADDDVVRREHSCPTDTKDDDLVEIREEMAISLECSKVSNDTGGRVPGEEVSHTSGISMKKDAGVYVGVEEGEDETEIEDDGLEDIWKEMSFALECSKGVDVNLYTGEHIEVDGAGCDHYFVLKDDIGDVCRICGFIQRSIDTIFEFQYHKEKRSTRTYACGSENMRDRESTNVTHIGVTHSIDNLMATEISAHPKHRKEMKVHQVEGFNFLCSNLLTENPGGCILAHAPGSGKTFMVISFLQSFLDKNPDARPLVILPKGILDNWKKEFWRWHVEDLPLHDLYTSKAESRSQQLDVLKKWVKERSILFLGYMQFTAIVCDTASNEVAAECRNILLKIPSILILDEGHFPRNEETEVLRSLAQVQTPLKVVLSGTLYQNHVKEVFNILNLVRPKFLKLTSSREIVNRIMSRVQISEVRSHLKNGAGSASAFFELVEHALQNDEDLKTRKAVIQDLREMTSKVLHYYKGDFLDELPGLVDFTVLLNLSPKQKSEVLKLRQLGKSKRLGKFKQTSVGSCVYMHPQLKKFSEKYSATGERGSMVNDEKIDEMLEQLEVKEGAKLKFFLNFLSLCGSAGEKLLVFSQYILPLKLLERLSAKLKGWSPGKELFMITGDSNTEQRECSMERFNNSPNAKVFFGSIKACGEGISLVGASRIIILDVHLNPSVTRQAIGRAFRPGQTKKVYVYRLVAADSPEEEDYLTSSKKEFVSKMWFEWNEYCRDQEFVAKTIDVDECNDAFLESPSLREDVKVLYKR